MNLTIEKKPGFDFKITGTDGVAKSVTYAPEPVAGELTVSFKPAYESIGVIVSLGYDILNGDINKVGTFNNNVGRLSYKKAGGAWITAPRFTSLSPIMYRPDNKTTMPSGVTHTKLGSSVIMLDEYTEYTIRVQAPKTLGATTETYKDFTVKTLKDMLPTIMLPANINGSSKMVVYDNTNNTISNLKEALAQASTDIVQSPTSIIVQLPSGSHKMPTSWETDGIPTVGKLNTNTGVFKKIIIQGHADGTSEIDATKDISTGWVSKGNGIWFKPFNSVAEAYTSGLFFNGARMLPVEHYAELVAHLDTSSHMYISMKTKSSNPTLSTDWYPSYYSGTHGGETGIFINVVDVAKFENNSVGRKLFGTNTSVGTNARIEMSYLANFMNCKGNVVFSNFTIKGFSRNGGKFENSVGQTFPLVINMQANPKDTYFNKMTFDSCIQAIACSANQEKVKNLNITNCVIKDTWGDIPYMPIKNVSGYLQTHQMLMQNVIDLSKASIDGLFYHDNYSYGVFDGVNTGSHGYETWLNIAISDDSINIYRNKFLWLLDDPIDLGPTATNARIYDNRSWHSISAISLAPSAGGANLIWNNSFRRIGNIRAAGANGLESSPGKMIKTNTSEKYYNGQAAIVANVFEGLEGSTGFLLHAGEDVCEGLKIRNCVIAGRVNGDYALFNKLHFATLVDMDYNVNYMISDGKSTNYKWSTDTGLSRNTTNLQTHVLRTNDKDAFIAAVKDLASTAGLGHDVNSTWTTEPPVGNDGRYNGNLSGEYLDGFGNNIGCTLTNNLSIYPVV